MNNRRCVDCFYFKNKSKPQEQTLSGFAIGQCRVNPPTVITIDADGSAEYYWKQHRVAYGHWPYVSEEEWCGRFFDKNIKEKLEGAP